MGDCIGIVGFNGVGKLIFIWLLVLDFILLIFGLMFGVIQKYLWFKLGYYFQYVVISLLFFGWVILFFIVLFFLMFEIVGVMEELDVWGLLGFFGFLGCLVFNVLLIKFFGGQFVCCELVRLFWSYFYCLVLDELIIYLDYEIVMVLWEVLRYWFGVVVLVFYDCWFVKGVVENLKDEDVDSDGEVDDDEEDEEE